MPPPASGMTPDAGWTIWFNHKTHGRAELRVRDN